MDTAAWIVNFTNHFRTQREKIAQVQDPMFVQVLCCSALDPLATAAFTKSVGHRTKLQRLVEDLTVWPARRKVSLPQLMLGLREKQRHRYRLYRNASRQLKKIPRPNHYPSIDHSPSFDELESLAIEAERPLLSNCTYAALFCAYRNTLIHEFHPPGRGHDWSGRKTYPFYGISSESDRELVFPVGFVLELLDQAINGVEQRLISENINPYDRFEFGSIWRHR